MEDYQAIEFSFDELEAFAKLIRELNVNGVPYTLRKDSIAVEVRIYKGY